MKIFYILLVFLSITIGLLVAASNYCYLKKYPAKQKHLSPIHFTNNKLKKLCINNINQKMSNKVKYIIIKTEHTTFSMISST